ncbi:MAG: serine/threonine-protein kinase [Cellvibrio sp.]
MLNLPEQAEDLKQWELVVTDNNTDKNDGAEKSKAVPVVDKTRARLRSDSNDKTRAAVVKRPAPAAATPAVNPAPATEYTRFHPANQASRGFATAHEIAKQARAGNVSGSLLKKRFLLEDVLGQGGMGTVYKTKDLRKVEAEDPNPYIALKVLNEAFKNHPDAFVALQQETAKSHTLAHPNIVTVHDFDRDGDTLYMTMELLQGKPLDRLLRDTGSEKITLIPKQKALAIVRDLCAALTYAHQRHIIHADFKPGNIFISEDGAAKVLDFGIARAASKETQKHKFDAAQLGALTPAYATIEMVNDEPLSFADDVYALACVVYEIFSGQHPYQSLSALDAKQKGLKPKPIPSLNHREWRALSHALALDKNQRTPTVPQFKAEMFPRRSTAIVSLAIMFAVVSVGGAAWLGYQQYQSKLELEKTIAENIAQAQTCFAQSDFGCALERSTLAANLDEDNAVATQLIKAAQLAQKKQEETQRISKLLNEGNNCLVAQDDACAKVKAKEVLALDAKNQQASQLLIAANDLDKNKAILENVQQAETCLLNKDVACANTFAKRASELNEQHPSVQALNSKLQNVEQQDKLAALEQQQKISSLLSQSQTCLAQRKYDCAIRHADTILALDAANGPAMEVKQTAAVADKQVREAQEKVSKILSQAKECLDKLKNYTCAIAKAEAALDIMPNNADAIAIKTRAQDTQRRIKETGFNIK